VFQVHAVSEAGDVVVRRQLKRRHVLHFFAALRPCLRGWRPVRPRITGHEN
jgi:transposase